MLASSIVYDDVGKHVLQDIVHIRFGRLKQLILKGI